MAEKIASKAQATAKANAPVIPAAPQFKPNFKVKSYDKEFEIPEMFRGLIKDDATQKEVQAIFEKAYGMDMAKPIHQSTQEKYRDLNSRHTQLNQELQAAGTAATRGDYDTAFKLMGIDSDQVLDYFIEKARVMQLPPDQRQVVETQKQMEQRLYQTELQNRDLQQRYESQVIAQKQNSLSVALQRPGVAETAQQYDQRVNQPGAFAQKVIERAAWLEQQTGQDVTADQAVADLLQFVDVWRQPQAPQNAPAPQQTQELPRRQNPPVIPNIQGKGVSPVKRIPKSIAELKALADSMQD